MADNSYKTQALQFVAINNDQTDGLVVIINASCLPERDKKLIINHMKRLQRGLAKATDSELEYMELLDQYRRNR